MDAASSGTPVGVAPGSAIALEASALSKRYGSKRWALREVSFAIPRGGLTALVGPNAAGKSTLIRTWLGFERPTSGHARVLGHDSWRDRRSALTALGYVPQTAPVYEALTVREHLELIGGLRQGFSQATAEARLLDLGVPLAARRRELSGGQQAQLVLAMALGTQAEILLLDEPLAQLDPLARREFLRILQTAVAKGNRTAVLSSHVVTDVEQTCDYILVLGVGRVLFHGSIADALAGHSVATPGSGEPGAVAQFAAPDGRLVELLRVPADARRRPPALEDVVLGYLAAAREAAQ